VTGKEVEGEEAMDSGSKKGPYSYSSFIPAGIKLSAPTFTMYRSNRSAGSTVRYVVKILLEDSIA